MKVRYLWLSEMEMVRWVYHYLSSTSFIPVAFHTVLARKRTTLLTSQCGDFWSFLRHRIERGVSWTEFRTRVRACDYANKAYLKTIKNHQNKTWEQCYKATTASVVRGSLLCAIKLVSPHFLRHVMSQRWSLLQPAAQLFKLCWTLNRIELKNHHLM